MRGTSSPFPFIPEKHLVKKNILPRIHSQGLQILETHAKMKEMPDPNNYRGKQHEDTACNHGTGVSLKMCSHERKCSRNKSAEELTNMAFVNLIAL
jgi:hypothetical protein